MCIILSDVATGTFKKRIMYNFSTSNGIFQCGVQFSAEISITWKKSNTNKTLK